MKIDRQTNMGRFLRLWLLLAIATVGLSASSKTGFCQDTDTKKEADKKSKKEKSDSDKSPSSTEKKKASPVTAIVGGDIHTVTGPVIREGTILVQDGKILEVGQTIAIPKDAKVIDAKGKTITPGFVAISMRGIGIRSTPTGNEKLADALDPFDRNMKYSLGVGITTGCIELSSGRGGRRRRRNEGEPEEIFLGFERPVQEFVTEAMLDYGDQDTSLCPCCGLPILPTEPITPTPPTREQARKMAVIKMSYGDLDSMLTKESVFYSPSPGALSGALNRHNWRRDIKKARESIKEQAAAEKDKKTTAAKTSKSSTAKTSKSATTATAKRPQTKAKPELISLLKRETSMRIRANSIDEIRDMVELSSELGYDIVIEGGIEAWVLARELGASDVSVIFTPRQRREARPDRKNDSGSSIESTGIFEKAGVPFAIASLSNSISTGGLAGRDLTSLPLEAAFAVRGGAAERTALESLTITPAKMMGLEEKIGSIEPGKDADILILNGSPLDYRTYVEQAIVAGKVAYDRAKDRVFPVYDRE